MRWILSMATFFLCMSHSRAFAASAAHLNGAELSVAWAIPFVGLLLSIALFPLLSPHIWEHHFGKIAALWALIFILPCAAIFGVNTAVTEALHTMMIEYLPFIILLFSLFAIAGGIRVHGNLVGTPGTNTAILAFGTLAASLLGTTGASMLLIRPILRANKERRRKIHVFVFFIFLVSNIGGSLTPLGDPPLFLGFLKGIDFLWTLSSMFPVMLFASGLLLILFYIIDRWAWSRESDELTAKCRAPRELCVDGLHNVVYLAGVVAAVLVSGLWDPGIDVPVGLGIAVPINGLMRDVVLIILSYLSLKTTRPSIRIENAFTWIPIKEVAILFAGIFITMIPALAILRAGREGALAPLVALTSTPDGQPIPAAYFWMTGALSSFLDNAPTYLVFFNLAGGVPQTLMGPLHSTLLAISAGAVFMGANSYIGNAPNFMVKSICEERGIKMPSFFGYMLWSCSILVPLFLVITFIFF